MNEPRCETVQERLPDLLAGTVSHDEARPLHLHLESCDECREVRDLLALLSSARPTAPARLADRVETAVRSRRGSVTRPWWGLAAAAVAALALGIGVSSDVRGVPEVPAYVAEAEVSSPWLSDDGIIAGAPALGDLSEEALMTLLDEMGAGPSGGAA